MVGFEPMNFATNDAVDAQLERLLELTTAQSKSEAIRNALRFYLQAIEEKRRMERAVRGPARQGDLLRER